MTETTRQKSHSEILSGTLTTTDHHRISYDHYQNGHGKAVIIAHRFYNSKDALLLKDLASQLINEYDVIIFDFRGHGKSSGLFFWTSSEYRDLQAVLRYAKECYPSIGVVGFSLGAATGIITAARTDMIKSLICVSAPADIFKIENQLWKLNIKNDIIYNFLDKGRIGKGVCPGPFWLRKERPIDLVERVTAPICYIHRNRDWLVNHWHSAALFERTTSKKRLEIIENGPHAEFLMLTNKTETVGLIKHWFNETL